MCYLGGIWRRLEQLERISGRFPSVDQSSRFAGVPNLGKPVDLNVHMNLFQGDSDQRFVTRIWLDYEKQNECE